MNVADIVISLNGRDAGKRFIVIDTEGEYSLIADGKGRRYEKPKRKKSKHLMVENKADSLLAEKLTGEGKITNNEIRKFLATYATECCDTDTADNFGEGGKQNAKR